MAESLQTHNKLHSIVWDIDKKKGSYENILTHLIIS